MWHHCYLGQLQMYFIETSKILFNNETEITIGVCAAPETIALWITTFLHQSPLSISPGVTIECAVKAFVWKVDWVYPFFSLCFDRSDSKQPLLAMYIQGSTESSEAVNNLWSHPTLKTGHTRKKGVCLQSEKILQPNCQKTALVK